MDPTADGRNTTIHPISSYEIHNSVILFSDRKY